MKRFRTLHWLQFVVVVLGLCSIPNLAFAHLRNYVWTEVYRTLPQGGREIEQWTTLKVPNGNRTNEHDCFRTAFSSVVG